VREAARAACHFFSRFVFNFFVITLFLLLAAVRTSLRCAGFGLGVLATRIARDRAVTPRIFLHSHERDTERRAGLWGDFFRAKK
jgi:hypothetical protein